MGLTKNNEGEGTKKGKWKEILHDYYMLREKTVKFGCNRPNSWFSLALN